ncbi:MAG: phosphotransferase, partial [Planctomycetota bacterium]
MSLLHQTPQFSVAEAQSIALSLFGIDASEVQVLPSDRDQNFLLQQYESNRFVLKISNAGENVEFIKAQSALLRHVEGNRMDCPKLVSSRNQNDIEFVEREGQRFPIRLVTYLEGRTLASVKFHPLELMQDLGRNIGGLTKSLKGFEHPALKREFQWDLQQAANVVQRKLHFVENEDLKQQIEQLAQRFGSYTKPLLGDLAHSVVQNDANDGNVLVEQVAAGEVCRRVTGLIDFGDAVYSWTIAELAIALAYTMLDKDDPLRVASEMIRGYVGEHEITESELAALFGLACMRLCASAVIAHEQHRIRPDDPYLMISQEPIRRTLPKLLKIPFEFATAAFRVAAGQPASSSHAGVVRWLKEQEDFPFPINPEQIGKRPQSAQLRVYDLGVSSPLLAPLGTSVSEPQLTKILFSDMDAAGISVGVGRYMEARLLYQSDQFSSGDACETSSSNSLAEERRTLHLGIDLFATAGAPVIAPLAGTIEIATVIDKALDYGGLLILRHQTEAGESFFTLYGHLAPASIADKSHGDHIEAGATIAELGEVHENGGWTPHLHFQLLLDLFG